MFFFHLNLYAFFLTPPACQKWISPRRRRRSPRTAGSGTRNARNVKFTNATFIVARTFSRSCQSPRARARRAGACGRYFTTESRATSIVLRENGFLPRSDVRAVVPFAGVITSPRPGRRSSPGFSVRKPPAWRIMAAVSIVSPRCVGQYVL
ncbi:hypothetical protein PUN28_006428 [Cardiocondyla obscurior]|uniref:Secreted protein n=1 Tax=Cardiocondyla obscurior TaxID=286306 RepID=A0AAW2GDW7_9HYME